VRFPQSRVPAIMAHHRHELEGEIDEMRPAGMARPRIHNNAKPRMRVHELGHAFRLADRPESIRGNRLSFLRAGITRAMSGWTSWILWSCKSATSYDQGLQQVVEIDIDGSKKRCQ